MFPIHHAPTDPTREIQGPDTTALQQQLAQCRADLLAMQQEQAAFARGISHDLRAPLRAIDSFSALLARNPSLDAGAQAHLARVRAASTRMGTLLDALLELSRVNRAEFKPETVDLGLLADWVGAELQEAEPERDAVIVTAPGLSVCGDERLLKALLGHLLDNAWKFSAGCERVRIAIGGERSGTRLQVSVCDEGCGFDMQYADKLFEPFQRLLGPEHGGGNGIGLAIAQRIVERHGGRLSASSEPGVGSCFRFDLAVADPAA
jgi:signal transduction histidine kinase